MTLAMPWLGPGRHRLAEELLADRGVLDDVLVAAAQAHAALAFASGTAMAGDFGNHAEPRMAPSCRDR
jgi:hypothetical protein